MSVLVDVRCGLWCVRSCVSVFVCVRVCVCVCVCGEGGKKGGEGITTGDDHTGRLLACVAA